MTCPECGSTVADPGLYLAQPTPDSVNLDYCSARCGSAADQRTMAVSTRATQPYVTTLPTAHGSARALP